MVASVPVAIVLLLLYLVVVGRNLRRHREQYATARSRAKDTWSMPAALAALAVATGATAWVSEILVHSLDAFAKAVGLSEFFISVVIVAIVGNAAEHGGAIVIARDGKMRLATEIAISSSAQVGLLVVPVVTLLSLLFTHPLALSFRWTRALRDGGRRGRRRGGRVGRPFEPARGRDPRRSPTRRPSSPSTSAGGREHRVTRFPARRLRLPSKPWP